MCIGIHASKDAESTADWSMMKCGIHIINHKMRQEQRIVTDRIDEFIS